MTLDIERLAEALPRVVRDAETDRRRTVEIAAFARETMKRAPSVDEITQRVRSSGRKEALAVPLEPVTAVHALPERLDAYTVVAVDGSHHELDRYSAAACAVVNLGGWRLRYGPSRAAEQMYDLRVLTAEGHVLDDGTIVDRPPADDAAAVAARVVRGPLLGSYRGAWETQFLARNVRAALADDADTPLVGLLDGVLLPWTVPGTDDAARSQVARMLAGALSELRDATNGRRAAVGSYVSHPHAGEVMNMLDVLAVDGGPPLAGRADWLVFRELAPGERSAAFETFSAAEHRPQREHFSPAGHETGFFYVNTAPSPSEPGEVARVEFPSWLQERPGCVALLHAAVLDQCRLGWGYPLALQEAHERAVLSGDDRRAFEAMVEGALVRHGIAGSVAGKHMSKRVRGL